MPKPDLHVTCACGQHLAVTSGMAGTTVRCRCGRESRVPELSELRRTAGADPYVTTAVEAINKMLNRGELPSGPNCIRCHTPTSETVHCEAVCERSWTKRLGDAEQGDFIQWFGRLMLPVWASLRRPVAEVHGRDVVVHVAFRLCSPCQKTEGSLRRQRTLKRLLRTVSLYRQLLEEYPEADLRLLSVGR